MIEPHIPNVRKKKLQLTGHTIPASRRNIDRYIIRRPGLSGRYLIQDTLTGEWLEPSFLDRRDAVSHANELNGA